MRSLKELASLGRDRVLAAFIVYSFSLSVYSQATGIKTDVANAPIAIVDSDQSALSARIHDGLLKPYFRRPDAIDRSIVDRTMDVGNYAFVLDVPPRLEADLLRGRSPTIQLNIDATAMTQAAVGGRLCGVDRAPGDGRLSAVARHRGAVRCTGNLCISGLTGTRAGGRG
jgi:ABC-2 type transport system permease protein